jgi:hypothetical protein
MENQIFTILKSVLPIISLIISIILSLKTFNKGTLENIKKRHDIYKEIILNKNDRMLSFTLLKNYLKIPIKDELVEYILNSTKFYEFVTIYKNIYEFIDFNTETGNIIFKNNRKPNRIIPIIFYVMFSLPFFAFIIFLNNIILFPPIYFILSIIIVLLFLLPAIYFYIEIGNRTLAIKLVNNLN